jgi:hypothetical protein
MANRTIAEQITVLEAERTRLETAISAAQSGNSSYSVDGLSVTKWRLTDLRAELTRVEKSLQRLYRGGRGIVVDMSAGTTASDDAHPVEYVRQTV